MTDQTFDRIQTEALDVPRPNVRLFDHKLITGLQWRGDMRNFRGFIYEGNGRYCEGVWSEAGRLLHHSDHRVMDDSQLRERYSLPLRSPPAAKDSSKVPQAVVEQVLAWTRDVMGDAITMLETAADTHPDTNEDEDPEQSPGGIAGDCRLAANQLRDAVLDLSNIIMLKPSFDDTAEAIVTRLSELLIDEAGGYPRFTVAHGEEFDQLAKRVQAFTGKVDPESEAEAAKLEERQQAGVSSYVAAWEGLAAHFKRRAAEHSVTRRMEETERRARDIMKGPDDE